MTQGMKWMAVLPAAVLLFSGCSSITRVDSSTLTVVPVSEVVAEPARWEAVGKEIQAGRPVVFHIPKGGSLPLKLTMALPMTTLEAGENRLRFTRDTYLLVTRSSLRIGPDGQRWADISDFQAQKELFGYREGSLSIGFHATKAEGTHIAVDIRTR
jgi:hypothetical protein